MLVQCTNTLAFGYLCIITCNFSIQNSHWSACSPIHQNSSHRDPPRLRTALLETPHPPSPAPPLFLQPKLFPRPRPAPSRSLTTALSPECSRRARRAGACAGATPPPRSGRMRRYRRCNRHRRQLRSDGRSTAAGSEATPGCCCCCRWAWLSFSRRALRACASRSETTTTARRRRIRGGCCCCCCFLRRPTSTRLSLPLPPPP